MNRTYRLVCFVLAASLMFSLFFSGEVVVDAATALPSDIYLTQASSNTCTLCAATMMLRARMYLSGNDAWSSITEAGVRKVAWLEGTGMYHSFTYSVNNCIIQVSHSRTSGITSSKLKSLLDAHPEGIVLYCNNIPHAVFLTDYEGDTFYCSDPGYSSMRNRRTLASSSLGTRIGSQADILAKVSAYWYISSFSIGSSTPEVSGSQMIISGETVPSSITAGSTFSVKGTITSGDALTEVTVGCFDGDGNMVTGKTVYPNSKSYNIANVDAYILFDDLTPGMYDYCVIATNSGGTQYLVWQSFAVLGRTATIEDGYYYVQFSGSNSYALTINGTNAELSAFDKGDDQAFLIQYQDNGYYSVYNHQTGLCLDVENAASDYGTNVHAYSGNGSNAQRWQILPAGTNRWCMVPECASSLCLDVADGVFAQGQNVQLWGTNLTNAQTLRLQPCVPEINVSENNITLTMGETETATIEVGITGCFGDKGCNYVIAGGNVECAWGGATESGGALLTISAITPGTSTVYVYLYDLNSGAVVVDTAVDVTVLQNDNSTLYYDANGGTQTVYSQPGGSAGTLTDVVIKDEIPTRFGYNFAGWADFPGATQPQFLPGDTISFYYDTTLYAVWVTEWIQPSDFDAVQANILYPGVGVYYQYTPTVSTYYRLYGCDTLDNRVKLFEANGNLLASDDDNGQDRQFELQHYLQAGDTYFIYVDLYGSTTGSFYFAFVDGYAVIYHANGGSNAPASEILFRGTANALSSQAPNRTGYTFLGWATSSSATSAAYQPGDSFPISDDTTLYAVWKANTYTVSYNANGGSGAPGSQTKTHGTALTLSSTRPTRSGYTFLGWATSSTATSAAYQPGGSFTTNANTTLYAVWKENTVTNAPQIVVSSATGEAGKTVTLTLSLKNNPGISGLAVSLVYDEEVFTLREVQNGALFGAFTSGKNYIWDESQDVTDDGVLATFVFDVSADAEPGQYAIEVISRSCVNIDLEYVTLASINGTVTITDVMYGDANGDNKVDMKDVVLLRKYMANFDYDTGTSTVAVYPGADANGDGSIDMKDVVLLRKYMANYDYDTGSSSVILGPK